MPNENKTSVRIRMYRQGLGDCFLLTFQQEGKADFNLMIDCGLLVGTKNGNEIMQQVAEDIEATLPIKKPINGIEKKWLDAVVMTHEHADHISGFSQAEAVFDRIHFGEVWAGWMDDENHPKYKAVRERFHKQVTGLKAALAKMTSDGQKDLKETINALVNEFFEPNILGATGSTSGRSPAWDYVLDKAIKKKFFSPGNLFTLNGFEDIRIYVLGPPEDYETFTKVNPPTDETYRSEGRGFALADSFFAAVAEGGGTADENLYQPFEEHLRIDLKEAQKQTPSNRFFNAHYGFAPDGANNWRRINDDWLTTAGGLALNLDSYTNNTCLALAIEFVKSGKVLLFPGDAQFANLISWQKLSWELTDANGIKQSVKTEDLLKRTVFYKVGHHGSHNATLKAHGLEMMSSPDLTAMIPVDRHKAEMKKWEMPEHNLFETLNKKTRGRVILADESDHAKLQIRCQDTDFISKVKFDGSFVRDPTVPSPAEPLYVEFTIEG